LANLAGGKRPRYQVTLSDGVNTVGIMAHTADKPSARAIRRLPRGPGVERKSIVQSTFMGGRGGYRFANDNTRISDAGAAWTMVDGFWISGPLPHFCTGGLMHRVEADQPGGDYGVRWAPILYQALARKIVLTTTMSVQAMGLLIRKIGTPASSLFLEIYSNVAGAPGATLASANIPPNLSTHDELGQWLAVDFGTPLSLTGGTTYWLVARDGSGVAHLTTDPHWELGVHGLTSTITEVATLPVTGPPWLQVGSNMNLYWRLDGPAYIAETQLHFFEYKRQLYCVSQADDGSAARLWINGYRGVMQGGGQLINKIKDSTANWPANSLNNTVVLIIAGPNKGKSRTIISDAGAFANTATTAFVRTSWATVPVDLTTEYVILGSDVWTEITGTGLTAPVTSVQVMNSIVYFAQGNGVNIRKMREYNNAGAWTREFADDGTNRADFLCTFTDESGILRMYRGKNDDVTFSKADKTAWASALVFDASVAAGDSEGLLTGMVVYDDRVHMGKEDKIGTVKNGIWVDVPVAMASGRDENNAVNLIGWNTNLYFPFLDGYERLYGQVVDDIGPNRNEGFVSTRRGRIADFKPVLQYGYAALDGGVDGQSSILATTAPGGDWHELYRAPLIPTNIATYPPRIRNLFYQSIPGRPNRLWFSQGADMCYLNMPRDAHTPLNDVNMRYAWQSYITTCWYDDDSADLDHFWDELRIFSRSLGTTPAPSSTSPIDGEWIEIDYQLDNDTTWTRFPVNVVSSPHQVLPVGGGLVKGHRIRFRLRGMTSYPDLPVVVNALDLRLNTMHEVLYDYILDFQAKDRIMMLSGGDSRARAKAAMDILATWQENAVLLTWRCVIPAFDNLRGHIDPVSLVPRSWQTNNVELSGSLTFKAN
jgi:hypothetical protein